MTARQSHWNSSDFSDRTELSGALTKSVLVSVLYVIVWPSEGHLIVSVGFDDEAAVISNRAASSDQIDAWSVRSKGAENVSFVRA